MYSYFFPLFVLLVVRVLLGLLWKLLSHFCWWDWCCISCCSARLGPYILGRGMDQLWVSSPGCTINSFGEWVTWCLCLHLSISMVGRRPITVSCINVVPLCWHSSRQMLHGLRSRAKLWLQNWVSGSGEFPPPTHFVFKLNQGKSKKYLSFW